MRDPALQHAKDRNARAIGSVVAGLCFQGTYVLAQFVILAVLFREFGEERFGMWVTIFSLSMWLGVLPLGMDRALLTWLGRIVFHQPKLARRVIQAAAGVVLLSTTFAVFVILLLGRGLPWADTILNVRGPEAVRDAGPTAMAALLVTAISIPCVLGGFVLQAYQRGALRYLLGMVAQLFGLGMVLVGAHLDWPLPWLGVLIVSPLFVGGALHWLAAWRLIPPRQPGGAGTQRVVGPMLATGLGLWLSDLALILLINSGAFVVAQVQGAAGVVPYGAVYRLVGPLFVCYVVIAHSYWPAMGDAAHAHDRAWIVKAIRHSLLFVAGLWLVGAAGCLLLGQSFIVWWLGEGARPDTSLIVAGLVFALAIGVYHISTAAMGGMGYVKFQAVVSMVVLGAYCLATWWSLAYLDAGGVMLMQATGIGLIGLINGVHLARVLAGAKSQAA